MGIKASTQSGRIATISLIVLCLILIFSGCTLPVDPCSKAFLINAINSANTTPATTDVIDLAAGCIYELDDVVDSTDGANGLPSIISPIVINGNGATIRRSLSTQKMAIRLFHVSATGNLTLNDLILLDGLGMNPPDVSLPDVNYGGAVYNRGQLTINNCELLENRAVRRGGGIYNAPSGTILIHNSTLQGNTAGLSTTPGEHGGGIYNAGTAAISNSTLTGNQATQTGGGVASSGTLTISNTTLSGNTTSLLGGSAVNNSGTLLLEYATIAFNSGGAPGAALFSAVDTIHISNTILSDNLDANCSYPGTSTVAEENISSDGSCSGFSVVDDPQLEPLANNGGLTMTHAFAPSSPAKNGAAGACPPGDQRGEPRPHGPACDLGAYEFSGSIPATSTPVPADGSISGWTYIDGNDNGMRDAAEVDDYVSGAILTLAEGACPGTATLATTESSAADGSYLFDGLTAGTYCVLTSPLQQTLYPESQAVLVETGVDVLDVNFRFVPSPMATLTPTATFVPTSTFTPVPPTPTFTSTPVSKGPSITDTPVVTGQIFVNVWKDPNYNGVREKLEDPYPGVRVYVGTGACDDRAAGTRTEVTDSTGTAFFDNIPLMTYCVYTEIVVRCRDWTAATTDDEFTVVVDHGAAWVINIGYAIPVC